MTYFIKKICISSLILGISCLYVHAAKITLSSPSRALPTRAPIVVQVFLDPEQDTLSGISANFSFPSELFSIDSISTEGSAVSLWVTQPKVSSEKYLDNRTHITFEGIFPGGYDGVRSPYYIGKKPGLLFYITLIPKAEGNGVLVVDEITFHAFDAEATAFTTESAVASVKVPTLTTQVLTASKKIEWIPPVSVNAFITQSELVNANAWYLMVNEEDQKTVIKNIYVAETYDTHAQSVAEERWHEVTTPYVLFYQDRSRFVHVKILYANNTYTTVSLAPVENSKSITMFSRILVSIITLIVVVYLYGKHLVALLKKLY